MGRDKEVEPGHEQNGGAADLQNPQQMVSEMTKAFQELQKGEQTASALEKQLDDIESKIDALLAAAEAQERASHEERTAPGTQQKS